MQNHLLAQKARGQQKTRKITSKSRNSEQARLDTFAGAQIRSGNQGQGYDSTTNAEKKGKSKLLAPRNPHFQFRFWLFQTISGNLQNSRSQKYIFQHSDFDFSGLFQSILNR